MTLEVGTRVRARGCSGSRHTRLPGYLREKAGTIAADLGEFPFADERATGRRDAPVQRLFNVRFAAREIWGDAAGERDTIAADLFESYLERDA